MDYVNEWWLIKKCFFNIFICSNVYGLRRGYINCLCYDMYLILLYMYK